MQNRVQRVAFTGRAGVGKSTCAQRLVDEGYTEVSFAEPLKRFIMDVFRVDRVYCYDARYKNVTIPNLGVSFRELAQVIGTDLMRRALHASLPALRLARGVESPWVHRLVSEIVDMPQGSRIVVSDVRFPDEEQALRELGFRIIRVERPDSNTSATPFNTHESELHADSLLCDRVIANTGTLAELYERVDEQTVE